MKRISTTKRFLGTLAMLVSIAGIVIAVPRMAQSQQEGSGTTAPATTAQSQESESIKTPKVIAVKFHADWCGFCKAMGPVMTDLQNKFDGQPALFVTFDLTNQTSKNQAEMHAAALGLSDLWKSNGGSTGKIYLVEIDNRKAITTLTSDHTLKDMTASLTSALR